MMSRRLLILLLAAGVPVVPGAAQDPEAGLPAEERRLDQAAFRAGLKKRGLDEILELHLREYPPRDVGSRLMMERDIHLARYADESLPRVERQAAAVEANRLLARLIELRTDDPDRLEWRLTLARSLIAQEAEPYYSSILFRGGSEADRRNLAAITARAVELLEALRTEVVAEFERIDTLTATQFESLERSGYVQRLDSMGPEVDYRLMWALFYDALWRPAADPVRGARLSAVIATSENIEGLLDTPHEQSRVQVQALLLLGMTHMRAGQFDQARGLLDRVAATADKLPDAGMRADVDWAVTLSLAERIRTEIAAHRYEEALSRIEAFNTMLGGRQGDVFAYRLVGALLERECYRARAATAASAGERAEAARYRNAAWRPLARLARREPQHRDEIYTTINDLVGPVTDPAGLDPFERCALIAGLLGQAGPENLAAPLDRAAEIGTAMVAEAGEVESELLAEVLYNTGVAYYRRGRLVEAATAFARTAREHPGYDRALSAATLAVQLCGQVYPAERDNPAVREVYLGALDVLLRNFGQTPEAKYWRFFHAQLLEDVGRFDEAARQYGLLDESHDHFLDALFCRMRCLLRGLELPTGDRPRTAAEQQAAITEFFEAQRTVLTRLTPAAQAEKDVARAAALRGYLAQAAVLYAEAHLMPAINRPEKAIETLAGFEKQHPDEKAILGRVLRVRVLAFEKLGRIDEATALIPAYLAADPVNAGPALQSLYIALSAEAERLEEAGEDETARRKAETALYLAERIDEWARDERHAARIGNAGSVAVQLAEANLRAGRYEKARDQFAACLGLAAGVKTLPEQPDLRAAWGFSEALYQSGDYAAALPLFNKLFLGMPESDPRRLKALLRDLQSRSALGEPAADIVKVILQQETLHAEIGPSGTTRLARDFQALKRENEQRVKTP